MPNLAVIDVDGFLAFKASDDGHDPYIAHDDGTVPAVNRKWFETESYARWLRQHVGADVFLTQGADFD